MSPGSLEAQGLIQAAEYQRVIALTQSASPDAHKKIADFFGRVKDKAIDVERVLKEKDHHGVIAKIKEGAENVHTKIQAKVESSGLRGSLFDKGDEWSRSDSLKANMKRNMSFNEPNHTMEIAQLLLSLLHAWGMDPDLDRVCEGKLGLLRPMVPVSFGVLSKGGYMSFLLPTYQSHLEPIVEPTTQLEQRLPIELVRQERLTRAFTSRAHWELSTTLTSNHLLAVVALSNTLMSMNNATFVPEQERNRKMRRPGNRHFNWSKIEARHKNFIV